MKKIFFISWNNPKFYNLIIFLSRKLSLKNYQIKIYAKRLERRDDIIEKLDFGKNCKIIYCPIQSDLFPNFLNLLFFSIFCLFKYISIKPENIIFFNQKALIPFLFIRAFKNNCN